MKLSSDFLLIITLFVCVPVVFVQGEMSCFQCNSTLNHNCQEYFNHDNPNKPLRMSPCRMYNAKFCIKATGLWGGVVGTHRFCSSRDLGNQCQDMRFPDHSRKYRGCIYTCGSDGCNAASSMSSVSVAIVTLFTFITSYLCR